MTDTTERTRVAICGAGPAGLLLSHLLAEAGIDSIVVDARSREEIETTIRAGILEQGTVEILTETGVSDRVHSVGDRHAGIHLGFGGELHHIDFGALIGRGVWLYPQHEVLVDLIGARLRDGQDLRFGVSGVRVEDAETTAPQLVVRDADGRERTIVADVVVGADGSRSVVREAVTGSHGGYFHEYPFAWFGILCEAPPSKDELIYSNSPDGFALISQRSPEVQRMYFQCDPDADPNAMSEEEIWAELQRRTPGTDLAEGPIFQRDVLRFRSFVAHRMSAGRAVIVGDAAHTVPPTGAKGMNLAVADVVLLNRAIRALLLDDDDRPFERFTDDALRRVWKAQQFSWWMTSMLHRSPTADAFEAHRQIAELRTVTDSEAGRRYLAEAYTGWPLLGR